MSFREWAENQGRLGSGKSAKVEPQEQPKEEAAIGTTAAGYLHQHILDVSATMIVSQILVHFCDWCL